MISRKVKIKISLSYVVLRPSLACHGLMGSMIWGPHDMDTLKIIPHIQIKLYYADKEGHNNLHNHEKSSDFICRTVII